MQTSFQNQLHVALIMDGNGRWASARGLPRLEGHRAGAAAARPLAEAATALGIGALTLYAFSSDNWRRPQPEVAALMGLLGQYLLEETTRLAEAGIRLEIIGRRDRLPGALAETIARSEAATAAGKRLHLRVAIDYSSRDAILAAVGQMQQPGRAGLAAALGTPDVDLVVRTGGEQRLSDFMLWECAYAEFLFIDRMWPDFGVSDLAEAVGVFRRRNRRFGDVATAA